MRRKEGKLVPLEISILAAISQLCQQGKDCYGFQIAKKIEELEGRTFLSGYGAFYRALERLEEMGFLSGQWEDPDVALEGNRPRRRLYDLVVKESITPVSLTDETKPEVLRFGTAEA
jgi:PadR family transcriptional regulator PadR